MKFETILKYLIVLFAWIGMMLLRDRVYAAHYSPHILGLGEDKEIDYTPISASRYFWPILASLVVVVFSFLQVLFESNDVLLLVALIPLLLIRGFYELYLNEASNRSKEDIRYRGNSVFTYMMSGGLKEKDVFISDKIDIVFWALIATIFYFVSYFLPFVFVSLISVSCFIKYQVERSRKYVSEARVAEIHAKDLRIQKSIKTINQYQQTKTVEETPSLGDIDWITKSKNDE